MMMVLSSCAQEPASVNSPNDTEANPETSFQENMPGIENPSDPDQEEGDVGTQIQLIADNISLWQGEADTEPYGYAVTDLDQNGRLEIISSSCQGTGIYSYNNIWEVNEACDELTLLEKTIDEYTSQADILVESVPVYFDSGNNAYHYVFDDLTKNGAAEYYQNKRALCLQDGKLIERFLAYKTTMYHDSTPTVTCTDADTNPISEEDYQNIGDKVFSKMEKKQAAFYWITEENAGLYALKDTDIKSALKESYHGFTIS